MQSALFFICIFPPPSAGTEIFAWPDGTCAWRTTNTYKAAVMERVIGNIVFVYIVFYLLGGPMKDGVVLDHLVHFVPLKHCEVAAGRGMFGAQTGDPHRVTSQRPLQRLHF